VDVSPTAGFQTLPSAATPNDQSLVAYVRQAFDQLELQLSKEKLEQLQLSGYAQVVWASEPQLAEIIAPVAAEHASATGIQVFHLDAALGDAVVGGLLFSQLITLYITPVVYYYMDTFQKKFGVALSRKHQVQRNGQQG
jgi:Cu/Ag efflux pump CusA